MSQAMVLVAKDRDSEGRLEFVCPPESCPPGSIIEVVSDPSPEPVLNPKKKIFENVQPHFGVCPQSGVVQFLGKFAFKVGQDYVTVPTIRNAIIS